VPGQPLARFILAHIALERGELREAKRELDLLLAAGNDGYQLRMLRARIAKASGETKAVVPELEAAIAIDGDRSEAYAMLSDVAQQLGDTARLESSLRRLSELDQHSRGPLRRLLAVLRARSAGVELVEVARAGLLRDVEDGVIHLALAEGLMSTERLTEAHAEAERARTLASPADRAQATLLLRAIEAKQRAARPPARIDAKPNKAR
jgi:tetratricopeptide (TPR) repeat protein